MTDIIEQTRAILLTDPVVSGLVDARRIFPGRLDQGEEDPSIVLSVVSGSQGVTTDGGINHSENRLQVDCYATTYSKMEELFQAVRAILNGYSGGNTDGFFLEGVRDLFDTEAQLYRRSSDYMAWNREG